MKKLLLVLGFLLPMAIIAQQWLESLPKDKLQNGELSLYEIQQAFNDYWTPFNVDKTGHYINSKGEYVKAGGWKQFKRWEEYWETRVDFQTGKFPNTSAYEEYQKYIKANPGAKSPAGNWVSKGPSSSTSGYHGIGRISCVGFRPGDNNTLYAGAPVGGIWKSTDGGTNWTVLGQDNASIGVSDIVVVAGATTSSDIVYMATGDDDAGDCYSIGVLKSTDGGATWSTTGLSFTASQYRKIYRLIMDPSNNSVLYAATSAGVYKTTNAGSSWSNVTSNYFVDLEFKPGNSSYIYGSNKSGDVYRSTNSGGSWTQVLTTSNGRTELAVSANNPSVVYALITNSSNGLAGIYKSTNSGSSFSSIYTPGKNLLGWACDGSDSGGQGWYDLCIAADPNNANNVFVGGVNTWKSTNGGSAWSINNMWSGTCSGAATNVHADKHCLTFQNGTSTLFEGNDGGLYTTSDLGNTWSDITNGMVISQMYRIGVAQTAANDVICGLQDNGTKNVQGTTWSDVIGGDGMDCAVDYTNASIQYGEGTYGSLRRTTNHWGSSSSITSGLSGSAAWVAPFIIDLNSHNTIYTGYQDVFKSTNNGSSWTKISNWAGYSLHSLTIAPSNSNVICAATSSVIYRTTNGGTSWSDISSGLPSSTINWILIKDNDPNTLWVALGGFNSDGVYKSSNGGSTWTNISSGLPSIPINGVVQNKLNTSAEELYAATDVGVYYKSGAANWQLFSTNLPNVVVRELEIYYNGANSKLYASTYGRGLWESDLYSSASAPVAEFSADDVTPNVGQTVTFTDASTNSPTSWSWSFSPSTVTYVGGTTSSSQNPQVTFDAAGTYDVTLTATNASGSDNEVKAAYINASSGCSAITSYPWTEGFENGGSIPNCWSNEYVIDTQDWAYQDGGHSGHPASAHTGSYNAILYNGSSTANVTRLVTPQLDLSGFSSADLTFWHTQEVWPSDQDELRVYYKASSGGSWTLLATYTNSIASWTQEIISLPSLSNDYYIAFEGTAQYGYGVCVDDVMVDGSSGGSAPVAEFSADDVTPNVGQTVTFTDASTNSPTSWSWSFNPTTITYVGGTNSTSQNPQVTFDVAGAYDVTLTATNASGSDDEVKATYINASAGCTAITSYPYSQNFDSWSVSSPVYACTADGSVSLTDCWTNVTGDDIDWDIFTGSTGSGSTGPSSDHTGSGNYLYTEGSSCYSKTGYITSPTFDLTSFGSASLSFWYHMYGADMGTMSVQVSTNGGSTWSGDIWSLTGDQGNSWQQATVSLNAYVSSNNFVIRFTGLTGSAYTTDMAIDDIIVDGTSGVSNDVCSSATAINEVTDLAFDTSPATASGVQPSCGGSSTPPIDLWFAYTATFTGDAMFDLCGSSFDTRLTLWDACGGTELACNDDNGPECSGVTSSIQIAVTSGTTYYVQVGGYSSATGTGDLTIRQILNDDCASATAINEVTDFAFDTSPASASGVQPSCGGSSTPPIDLWYAYTATFTGNATIDLCGSSFDTRLTIWDACGGTEIACNDDACGYQSSVDIAVSTGTTYYIQVGGYNTATGAGDLTITPEYTWSGATDNDWATVSNWASGVVPNENVEVVLSSGASNYPILTAGNFTVNDATGTYKCKSLLIENGAQLEVYQSNDMLVYGNVTVESGGTLLLGDDLDVQSGGNLVISGGTVTNNLNTGNYGDIFFRDGSTGSMTGGTLTAYDQLEFYNTTFSATGGEIHCGGTNDETTIIVQTNPTSLYNFVVDADCKANFIASSDNTLQVNNFTANAGSSFTIETGETMQVNGDASFIADASGMASFIQRGTFNVTGTVDYQQYLTHDNWHQVAAPIATAQSGNYMDIYLYDWSEVDSLYTWHSVVYYPLDLGEGYYVWNPTTAKTVHFDGAFNNADFNKSLTYTPSSYTSSSTTGYNLVGNPFSSYLTYDNSWSMTNVDATFYVMNSATGNYVTMNPNVSTEIIPPTQGFFVKANATSASLTIPTASRTHTRGVDFYKGNQKSDILSLEITGNGSMDKISIMAKEDASYDFDSQYDAYDLKGLPRAPQLYMPIDGIDYSMNVIPNILESDIYPIAVEVGKTSQYEIKLLPTTLSDEFSQILLEDLQMQTTVNLNETNYLFVANQGDEAHRFNLRFSSPNGEDESFASLINVFSLNNTIIVQTSLTEGEITVYDMLGQEITSELIHDEITEIEMSNAQSYYIVEVKNNEQIITKKVYIK